MRTIERNTSSVVDALRPIDDTYIQKLGEDLEFCQEMLRVILDKPELIVISNTTQKSIHNIDTRSVVVDILCKDMDGSIFSVEVQKANSDDHQKRVRYNSSCVQVQSLDKSQSFKDLPDVYMIYITEKDFLHRNKVIYHIDRVIRETDEILDNGYYEIYVNTEVNDNSDIAEYMDILKSSDIRESDKFPRICELNKYYKEGKGRDDMCSVVEEYAKDYAKEYAKDYAKEYAKEQVINIAKALIKKGDSDEDIALVTALTVEEVADLRKSM